MSRVKSYYWEQLEEEARQYQQQNEIEYLRWYEEQKQKENQEKSKENERTK
jgi:hypothetical protein